VEGAADRSSGSAVSGEETGERAGRRRPAAGGALRQHAHTPGAREGPNEVRTMRRLTTILTLLTLVLLVVAAPAGARPKQMETYHLDGVAWPVVAVDGVGIRTVLEGSGVFETLGETAVVQTQRIVGWNGKDPFELVGKRVRGEIRLTAENGDELFGTYVGEIDVLFVPEGWELPAFAYLGELTFRNGTGASTRPTARC
jgi:hypothetical protein